MIIIIITIIIVVIIIITNADVAGVSAAAGLYKIIQYHINFSVQLAWVSMVLPIQGEVIHWWRIHHKGMVLAIK